MFFIRGVYLLLDVAAAFELADVFLQLRLFRRWQRPVQEAFPYIIDSLCGWMTHILGIETIVAKLIHHDFICREVVGNMERVRAKVHRQTSQEIVYAKQKG